MALISHTFETKLDQDTVLEVTRDALREYTEHLKSFNPQINWKDNVANLSFSAMGMSITGNLVVEDGNGVLSLDVPFFLTGMKDQVVSVIEQQIQNQIRLRGLD